MFSPLTQKEIQKIVELQMDKIAKRLSTQEITLHTTTEAIVQLARLGFDPQYGGRPVKRTLQKYVLNPLSKALLEGSISKEEVIQLDYFETEFIFGNRNEASN